MLRNWVIIVKMNNQTENKRCAKPKFFNKNTSNYGVTQILSTE